ncbi:hypothetical protein PM082_020044 [Marasmius tenuissimus]|nr:hypothetical protein PM082_020044 [Marasmius tenuissimus]
MSTKGIIECQRSVEQLQTREHILRTCPTYEPYRHILRKVSKDVALPDILGTPDGIEALSEFIEKCGAFTPTGQQREERHEPEYTPFDWFTHWNPELGDEWVNQLETEEPSWLGEWGEGEGVQEEEERVGEGG